MQSLGVILIAVAGLVWLGGGKLVYSARRRRLGQPSLVFNLTSIRLKDFSRTERRWLLALFLVAFVIGLFGLVVLQGAFG
jgi:hypothetical protein